MFSEENTASELLDTIFQDDSNSREVFKNDPDSVNDIQRILTEFGKGIWHDEELFDSYMESFRYNLTEGSGFKEAASKEKIEAILAEFIEKCKTDTKDGNAEIANIANTNLGLFHIYDGWGTEQDDDNAIKYLQKAVNVDYPPAQYFLGELYKRSKDSIKKKLGFELIRKASESGYPPENMKVKKYLEARKAFEVDRDYRKAGELFLTSALLYDHDAMIMLTGLAKHKSLGPIYRPFYFIYKNKMSQEYAATYDEQLKCDRKLQVVWLQQAVAWFKDSEEQESALKILNQDIFTFPEYPNREDEMAFVDAIYNLWRFTLTTDESAEEIPIDIRNALFNRSLELLINQLKSLLYNYYELFTLDGVQLRVLMNYCDDIFHPLTEALNPYVTALGDDEVKEKNMIQERICQIADVLSLFIIRFYPITLSNFNKSTTPQIETRKIPSKIYAQILIAALFAKSEENFEIIMTAEEMSWCQLNALAAAYRDWIESAKDEQATPMNFLSNRWQAKLKKKRQRELIDEEHIDNLSKKPRKGLNSPGNMGPGFFDDATTKGKEPALVENEHQKEVGSLASFDPC